MDGPAARIQRLTDADARTVWLTLRHAAGTDPALQDDSSLCRYLIDNEDPAFSAKAMKLVGEKFQIDDVKTVRAVIRQVCERKILRLPAAASTAAKQNVELTKENAKKVWVALRNMPPVSAEPDSSFCKASSGLFDLPLLGVGSPLLLFSWAPRCL